MANSNSLMFLELLATEIRSVYPTAYRGIAPDDAQYPFVTYNLPVEFNTSILKNTIYLDLNVWHKDIDDDPQREIDLETITQNLRDHFDGANYSTTDFRARIKMDFKNEMTDPDPTISRRYLRFTVRYYPTKFN